MASCERLHHAAAAILTASALLVAGSARADLGPVGQGTFYSLAADMSVGLALAVSDPGARVVDLSQQSAAGIASVPGTGLAFGGGIQGDIGYTIELTTFQGPLALRSIDLRDPAQPASVTTVDLPLTQSGTTGAMAFHGSVAYVGGGEGGMAVISLNDPFHPQVVGTVGTGVVEDVAVVGQRAYAVGSAGMLVLDVSQPHDPRILAELGLVGNDVVAVSEDRIVYRRAGMFRLLDMSNPSQVKLLDFISMVNGKGLEIHGATVYLHIDTTEILAVDVVDDALVPAGNVDVPNLAIGVTLDTGYLMIVEGDYDLAMVAVAVGAGGACGAGAQQALVVLAVPLGQILRRRRRAARRA